MLWWISAVSLSIVMSGCLVGTFAPTHVYNDNLAQRLGMFGVFMFCFQRFVLLMEHMELTSRYMPASAQLAGHIGLALFTIGTAYKAWKHNAKLGKRKPPLPPISEKHLSGVIGGHK